VSDARPETRWALTVPFNAVPLRDHRPLIEQAEAAGYDDLWTGETSGPDGFTPLALAAAWTKSMRLGTGVVNAFTRGPAVLAQHAAALQDASDGRFCLGIGSSSNVIVERWNQIPFEKPRTKVRETVEALRLVLAGERGPGGFKLDTAPDPPPPIYIAALRERMLQLGGALGDGTFVNFLPLSGLPTVIGEIQKGEREAGKVEGGSDVLCRFFCIPQAAEEGMPLAKFMFSAYATVPVYEQFFRWLGWGEHIDPMVTAWRDGDRAAAREAAPEDLIREIFIFGGADQQKARLAEFVAGGITTPVLTPICGPDDLPAVIDALAP
jgi:probable F420-dependent oxidoreductase